MSNAKRCDICGKYYDVPELEDGMFISMEKRETSMVCIFKRLPNQFHKHHDIMQFDSCESCLQDVLDYILTKRAESEPTKEDA